MTATPTDIPEDIFATARAVFASIAVVDWVEAEILIARAILAERERCAQIADRWNSSEDDDFLEPQYNSGRRVTAQFISSDIRNPQSISKANPNSARGFSSAERRVETAPPSPPGTNPHEPVRETASAGDFKRVIPASDLQELIGGDTDAGGSSRPTKFVRPA